MISLETRLGTYIYVYVTFVNLELLFLCARHVSGFCVKCHTSSQLYISLVSAERIQKNNVCVCELCVCVKESCCPEGSTNDAEMMDALWGHYIL